MEQSENSSIKGKGDDPGCTLIDYYEAVHEMVLLKILTVVVSAVTFSLTCILSVHLFSDEYGWEVCGVDMEFVA